ALKIRGGLPGHVKVEPQPGVTLTHPELQLKGDKTPEGDVIFWLPSGFWNVTTDQDNRPPLTTRLVPVSTGEMTELDVKPLLRSAYQNAGTGNTGGSEQSLVIEEAVEQGGEARVTFMLLDSENPRFTPDISDVEIVEGGRPGKLLELERIQSPPSVVLALDSSGSMSKSMDQVLA